MEHVEEFYPKAAARAHGVVDITPTAPEHDPSPGEVLKPDAQVFVLIGDRAKIEEKVKALGLGPVRLLDADGRPKSPVP